MSDNKPWSTYGIEALSPSAINKFIDSPASYVMSYVYKKYTPAGSAAKRGNAVEDGIMMGLVNNASIEEAVDYAQGQFDSLVSYVPETDEKKKKERNMIEGMVTQGIEVLKPYGTPEVIHDSKGKLKQHEVSCEVEGLGVRLGGKIDLYYPQHGLIVDIKTKGSMPQNISNDEARQGAVYLGADGFSNHEMRFVILTPKKNQTLMLHDFRERFDEAKEAALTIKRFLSLSDDKEDLRKIVFPNFDSWKMNESAQSEAKKVWPILRG